MTLEEDGIARFPDAPTERGVKHLRELIDAKENGYEAFVFFVIQMDSCLYFTPNERTHPEFAEVLREARDKGVELRAMTCHVSEDTLALDSFVEIRL